MRSQVEAIISTGVSTSEHDARRLADIASDIFGIHFIGVSLCQAIRDPKRYIAMSYDLPYVITHSSAAAILDGVNPNHFITVAAPTKRRTSELARATPRLIAATINEVFTNDKDRLLNLSQGVRSISEMATHAMSQESAIRKIRNFNVIDQAIAYGERYTLVTHEKDEYFPIPEVPQSIHFVRLAGGHARLLCRPTEVLTEVHDMVITRPTYTA